MFRAALAAALAVIPLALAACGSAGAVDPAPASQPGAGMCLEGVPDCVDTVFDPEGEAHVDEEAAREQARELIGRAEEDLPSEVRISRRGDEHLILTEDYVIGRYTVELDADADGVYRVTKVVTELEAGPETTEA